MNGDDAAVETARELERDLVQQGLSPMTVFELYHGVARVPDADRERSRVEDVRASKPNYPADATVMQKAGRLSGELANRGSVVDDADVIIGATATILDEPVLTRNVEDFEQLGVEVDEY